MGTVQRYEQRNMFVRSRQDRSAAAVVRASAARELSASTIASARTCSTCASTNKGPQIVLSRAAEGLVQRLLEQNVPEIDRRHRRDHGDRARAGQPLEGGRPFAPRRSRSGRRVPRPEVEPHRQRLRRVARREDRHHSLVVRRRHVHHQRAGAGEGDRRSNSSRTRASALVIVPDYQLSLAIGREGQNVRLAARLTGWRLDITSETEAEASARALPRRARGAQRRREAPAPKKPERPKRAGAEAPSIDAELIRKLEEFRRERCSRRGVRANKRARPVRTCVGCREPPAPGGAARVSCARPADAGRLAARSAAPQAPGAGRLPVLGRLRAAASRRTSGTRGLAVGGRRRIWRVRCD